MVKNKYTNRLIYENKAGDPLIGANFLGIGYFSVRARQLTSSALKRAWFLTRLYNTMTPFCYGVFIFPKNIYFMEEIILWKTQETIMSMSRKQNLFTL